MPQKLLCQVGSFDAAMLSIKETGVDEELKEISAKFQTPILGICLECNFWDRVMKV